MAGTGADKRKELMHVGVFFKNTGHHISAWRHPRAQMDAGVNVQHYVQCVQTCEKAGFDFIFFADSAAVRDSPFEVLSRSAQYTAYFEPITLLSALAMATRHIGLIATATTSYNEPYHVARKFASLDHISGGRAGWNVVTSGNFAEAWNFGRDEHFEHDFRYERATEFVEVVHGLWDSWDDDAFVCDRKEGRFFDPSRVHLLNHKGRFFKVRGPLNIPRPPQGYPVIFQAGTSDVGRELAAATAEGVFTSELTLENSKEHYADVKGRMAKFGRRPEQMRILPGCTVVCAPTEAEAREKNDYLKSLIHPDQGREYIGSLLGLDLSDCDIEGPLPDRPSKKSMGGTFKNITGIARRENLNIRQLYERLAGAHGKLTLVGSVNQVADTMQQWFNAWACDGFILQPSYMPGELDDIAAFLVPELRNRGLIRVDYVGQTLRDNLGLARPQSRYSAAKLRAEAGELGRMRIEEELKLDFKDVLIRPKRSTLTSRSEVDISREYSFRNSGGKYRGIPIIAANMDTVGTLEMALALAGMHLATALHKHYDESVLVAFFKALPAEATVFYSLGITGADYDKFRRVKNAAGDAIAYVCVDVANGYTKSFVDFIRKVRDAYPKVTMMAGNVVTGEMTEELILLGVDIVKVGIGPGSVCTTRKVAGVGYPQLSAIIECGDAAHGLGGLICSDGGCTSPGDLAKAFGGGADFIMLGGMLAGHDESNGAIEEHDGERKLRFYGMSSRTAMEKYDGGVANYRASEGKEVLIDYRGPVEGTVQEILGGVRSACTYVGARRLKELSKRTTFIRVARQLNEVFGS